MAELQATLDRIVQANQAVTRAHKRWEDCKHAAKLAKEVYDDAVLYLQGTVEGETRGPGPLFAADPDGDIAPGEQKGGATPTTGGEVDRRDVLTVEGLSARALDVLREAPFRTLGEFIAWTHAGCRLGDLPGATDAVCDNIMDAFGSLIGEDVRGGPETEDDDDET